jgi:hypothetical protein
MIQTADIEKRIDHAIAAPMAIDNAGGGLAPQTAGEAMELAKMMAVSGAAVPPWLRNNPGGCLAICFRALRWQMDPFAVAEKSYLAKGKGGEEHVGFEAQLVHAVVTSRAPLKGRLRSEIIGEGDDRRCRVWGTFKGEDKPHEYTSEKLGKKIADIGENDRGFVKGSPLWKTDPEVQLTYSAVRQWCRLHSPETLLGVYTPDEIGESEPIDVTPKPLEALAQRLRETSKVGGRGFSSTIESETEQDDENKSGEIGRPLAGEDSGDSDPNKKGSPSPTEGPETHSANATRQRATRKEATQGKHSDLFPIQEVRPKEKKGKR